MGTYTRRDIHKEEIYMRKEHTHGRDIHTKGHTQETYTRKGHIHGGTYIQKRPTHEGDIHTKGHTHGATNLSELNLGVPYGTASN